MPKKRPRNDEHPASGPKRGSDESSTRDRSLQVGRDMEKDPSVCGSSGTTLDDSVRARLFEEDETALGGQFRFQVSLLFTRFLFTSEAPTDNNL